MFAWGSKYFFALSITALLGAVIYGIASGGDIVGVISSGYKGGVGDHFGYSLLLGAGLLSACLGVLNVLLREADIDADVEMTTALTIHPPRDPSYWGVLGAFGVACLALGFSISSAFLYLGIVVLSVVALEWLVLAWSDRATGDAETNRTIRNRLLGPFEVPMFAMLAIAAGVVGISRVLLAVSHTAATVIASVLAALIFFTAVFLAKSNASRGLIAGFVSIMAIAVIGGGVAGAVAGQYEGEGHGEESHEESESGDEEEAESSAGESVSEEN